MIPNCATNNELSMHEAIELLAEVRLETEDCGQSSLFDFAGLLSDLIRLRQQQTTGDEINELAQFIANGLNEVRIVMDADQPSFERIDSLSEQAIDGWGEQLVAMRECQDSQTDYDWQFSTEAQSAQDTNELEPVAPSVVEALLRQFGGDLPGDATAGVADGEAQAHPAAAARVSFETAKPKGARFAPSYRHRCTRSRVARSFHG